MRELMRKTKKLQEEQAAAEQSLKVPSFISQMTGILGHDAFHFLFKRLRLLDSTSASAKINYRFCCTALHKAPLQKHAMAPCMFCSVQCSIWYCSKQKLHLWLGSIHIKCKAVFVLWQDLCLAHNRMISTMMKVNMGIMC